MKKIILTLTLAFFAELSNAQSDSAQISQVIVEYFEGLSNRDMERQKEMTTDDYILLEDGEIWNHDTMELKLKRLEGKSFERINRMEFIRTQVKGSMAWVAYYNHADITFDGKQRLVVWLESAVLIKKGNRWKIRMLHSTPIPTDNK